MVVGALQRERSQHALPNFRAPASITCALPAIAGLVSLSPVGMVSVQTLFDGAGGEAEHLTAHCGLQRFQVQSIKTLSPEQRFDVP